MESALFKFLNADVAVQMQFDSVPKLVKADFVPGVVVQIGPKNEPMKLAPIVGIAY